MLKSRVIKSIVSVMLVLCMAVTFVLFEVPGDVYAVEGSVFDLIVSAPQYVSQGDTVEVTISVENITDVNGLWAVAFLLEFDASKVAPIYTVNNDNEMDEFLECTPTYVIEYNQQMIIVPAWEQACAYLEDSNAYYMVFTDDTFEHPLKEDGELVITVPFTVLDDASGDILFSVPNPEEEADKVEGTNTEDDRVLGTGYADTVSVCLHPECINVVIHTQPTFTEDGTKTHTCAICGKTETVKAEKLTLPEQCKPVFDTVNLNMSVTPYGILEESYESFITNNNIQVVDSNGEDIGDNPIGTGCKMYVRNGENIVVQQIELVVIGDVDGDGGVTVFDLMSACDYAVSGAGLDGLFAKATLVSGGDTATLFDILAILDYATSGKEF